MNYEKYTEQYEFGGLNDNKKITAVFDHYQVETIRGENHICAVVEEGQIPTFKEGYGINGQKLWVDLQNLHYDICDKDDKAATDIIIAWCKNHVYPYYFIGDAYDAFDYRQETDPDFWDTVVNLVGAYSFTVKQMRDDLRLLCKRTDILLLLHSSIHSRLTADEYKTIEEVGGFKGFGTATPVGRLHMIKSYINSEIPKVPMGLVLDSGGEFRIAPDFKSVFDVAYYALAQYVTASPDYPLHWGARTGIGYCESCGNIFIKNGNRQKYCDNPECKKERNRRKAKSAYYRKIQTQADEEWS